MMGAPQGLHAFLRSYFHLKSADWDANDRTLFLFPRPLRVSCASRITTSCPATLQWPMSWVQMLPLRRW